MPKAKVCQSCFNKGREPICYFCHRNRHGQLPPNYCNVCNTFGRVGGCSKCGRDEFGKRPKPIVEDLEATRREEILTKSFERELPVLMRMFTNIEKIDELTPEHHEYFKSILKCFKCEKEYDKEDFDYWRELIIRRRHKPICMDCKANERT